MEGVGSGQDRHCIYTVEDEWWMDYGESREVRGEEGKGWSKQKCSKFC